MFKLISMVDFVLEQKITDTLDTSQIMWYDQEVTKLDKIREYANFLKQPLSIEMFIPCKLVDGVWVVLEEPGSAPIYTHSEKYLIEYKEIRSLLLFSGYEIKEWSGKLFSIDNNGNRVFFKQSNTEWYKSLGMETIEDLVKYNIELTPNALKKK